MKKLLLVNVFTFFLFISYSQINGPDEVYTNTTTTYGYHGMSVGNWALQFAPSGTTIVHQDNYTISIHWGSNDGQALLYIPNSSQQLLIRVVFGEIVPVLPSGVTTLPVVYPNAPPNFYLKLINIPSVYNGISWTAITKQNGVETQTSVGNGTDEYHPPILTQDTKYVCDIYVQTASGFSHVSKTYTIYVYQTQPLLGGVIQLVNPCVFNYNPDILSRYPAYYGQSYTYPYVYEWQKSSDKFNWLPLANGNTEVYPTNAITVLKEKVYVRRKVTCGAETVYTNTLEIDPQYTNVDWQNLNYVRENTIHVPNIKYWQDADQLPTGEKFTSTTYMDGLGRPIEKVSKEMATPASGSATWGDVVNFIEYDNYGRLTNQYLPYTTTTNIGKFKEPTTNTAEQINYYNTKYNEGAWAKSTATYDNSPLSRILNQKSPGQSWQNGNGNIISYEFNDAQDVVQHVVIDNLPTTLTPYSSGSLPYCNEIYPVNTLYKTKYTDVNGKLVYEFKNFLGQLVLKKVQLDNNAQPYEIEKWICTYNIYDDFGRLRFQIQPEGVKILQDIRNGSGVWTFNYATTSSVDLNKLIYEQFFVYNYDEKGRTVYKKAPGAEPIYLIYDNRDRVVFTQDGNQRNLTPLAQWIANVYDELDRPTITALYNTNKTIANLLSDINNAGTLITVSTIIPGNAINNLLINDRNIQPPTNTPTIPKYTAQNVVEFSSNGAIPFETNNNDEFLAEIDLNAQTAATTFNTTYYNNPIDINASNVEILKYNFYDNYNFPDAQNFYTNFKNTQAYATSANVPAIVATTRVTGAATGQKTKILGTTKFLTTTQYFNEDGVPIQTIEDNILNGQDITTTQHNWDGRIMSTHNVHSAPLTGITGYETLTKNEFDKIGRTTKIWKTYDKAVNPKKIVEYFYDDFGRVQTKVLDPDYQNPTTQKPGIEILDYSYNIHGQITGINKDYALKTSGKYQKWENYFGLYLGFDNKDNVFAAPNLAGQVTGLLWNTQGDDAQRKYDYTYDNAGRLIKADFTQKDFNENGYSNTLVDFSVLGHGNKNGKTNTIEYDLNGNLLTMIQKGVQTGNNIPLTIDDLQYTYKQYSNKLEKVTDLVGNSPVNGKFGDFKDGSNTTTTPDYVYDDNGNVIIDLNKDIKNLTGGNTKGIKYNFLDKPEEINIAGKGTIKIVYSAAGEKLRKIYKPATQIRAKYTTYINQFVYEETLTIPTVNLPILGVDIAPQLSCISFEEGRIRVVKPQSVSNGFDEVQIAGSQNMPLPQQGFIGEGVFDYFIRDYQENVRMILTEETHQTKTICTHEDSRNSIEQGIFGTLNTIAINQIPGQTANDGWNNPNINNKVTRLSKSTQQVGASSLVKVMAGDQVYAQVDYYYKNLEIPNNNSNLAENVLGNLFFAINNSNATSLFIKGQSYNIMTNNFGKIDAVAAPPNSSGSTPTKPKAYLTVLFFDEKFNFIPNATINLDEGSRFAQVREADANNHNPQPLQLDNEDNNHLGIKAPKNGYAFIYISNESNEPVYFDNLTVKHTRSRIIEENHYYSYGLKITAISSNKLGDVVEGTLKNQYLWQGSFSEFDEDIALSDFELRNYDPQIGRWIQQDPYSQYSSPYIGFGADPISSIDPDGGFSFPIINVKALVEATKSLLPAVEVSTTIFKASTRIITTASEGVLTRLTNAVVSFGVGVITAAADNLSFGLNNNREICGAAVPNKTAYNLAQNITDAGMVVASVFVDGAIITGGAALEIPSAGTVTLPAVAALSYTSVVGYNAAKNLITQKGRVNIEGSGEGGGNVGEGNNQSKNINKNSDKPPFAEEATPSKMNGQTGWKDKKGNFITKGDKPGEWHVNPNPKNRNPLWKNRDGKMVKPKYKSKNPYWNVGDNGIITH